MNKKTALAAGAIALVFAGCGSSGNSTTSAKTNTAGVNPNAKEKSPPGDIPDSTQFVRFNDAGGFSVRVPEGWSRSSGGGRLTFTSNLNSVTLENGKPQGGLTVAS
jgi:hypothetical protein